MVTLPVEGVDRMEEELPDLVELLRPKTSLLEEEIRMERGPVGCPWAVAVVDQVTAERMEKAGWRRSPTT